MRHIRSFETTLRQQLTVLNTVSSPLVLSNFSKYDRATIQEFVNDVVLSVLFEVLKGILYNQCQLY